MAEESTNGHGESRLDRMERLMELLIQDQLAFRGEHRQFRDDLELLIQDHLASRGEHRQVRNDLELVIQDHLAFRDEFRDEHRKLLTAQVVLTDRVDKLGQRVDKLVENSQRSDDRMDALIAVVDGVVRRPPPATP
jgi:uncharacterized protein (DUF3084 family)